MREDITDFEFSIMVCKKPDGEFCLYKSEGITENQEAELFVVLVQDAARNSVVNEKISPAEAYGEIIDCLKDMQEDDTNWKWEDIPRGRYFTEKD